MLQKSLAEAYSDARPDNLSLRLLTMLKLPFPCEDVQAAAKIVARPKICGSRVVGIGPNPHPVPYITQSGLRFARYGSALEDLHLRRARAAHRAPIRNL